MSEFDLIGRLAPYLDGAGDDAAVVDVAGSPVVLTTDVLVDGVHVDRALSTLSDVGWKAVAVNVSDVAAMGARPGAATVGLCLPQDLGADDVERLYAGMAEAAARWGVRLVGGDTVSADQLVVAVTMLGDPGPAGPVLRSGARPGDRLVLVGALGAAAAALAQHRAGIDLDPRLLAAHRRPEALPDEGLALAGSGAGAMIDVSDGLGADLGHLCAASGVRAVVDADALPVAEGGGEAARDAGTELWALVCGGGEDFALVAALPAGVAPPVGTVIGEVGAPQPGAPTVELVLPDGARQDIGALGYDHLAGRD
jgi:thiamine-monophosphate kinase